MSAFIKRPTSGDPCGRACTSAASRLSFSVVELFVSALITRSVPSAVSAASGSGERVPTAPRVLTPTAAPVPLTLTLTLVLALALWLGDAEGDGRGSVSVSWSPS